MDYHLLGAALALTGFGLVMMFSASGIWADAHGKGPLYYLLRQLAWVALGLGAMAAASRFDYNRLREWAWWILLLSLVSLVAVLFAHAEGGARRWIHLGPFRLQPAEFAKMALLLFLADYLDRRRSKVADPVRGMAVPWAVTALVLGLVAAERDIGTPSVMGVTAALLLFIGGARMRVLAAAAALALPVLAVELTRLQYRRDRIQQFAEALVSPLQFAAAAKARDGSSQLAHALLAVGSGGWLGKGLGASELKLLYIPAPHTDFIFPVIAEELGVAGGAAVLGLFALLLARGLAAARSAPNLFGSLLAAGLTLSIIVQAFVNIAMSVGLLPTKGISLPFFSYGGSSMLATLASVGVVLNISRQGNSAPRNRA